MYDYVSVIVQLCVCVCCTVRVCYRAAVSVVQETTKGEVRLGVCPYGAQLGLLHSK